MKINFDFHSKQFQIMYQVTLAPGENDLPDKIALELIAGSDALVESVADAKSISDDAARELLKGKGLCSPCVAPPTLSPKKKKEVKDNA